VRTGYDSKSGSIASARSCGGSARIAASRSTICRLSWPLTRWCSAIRRRLYSARRASRSASPSRSAATRSAASASPLVAGDVAVIASLNGAKTSRTLPSSFRFERPFFFSFAARMAAVAILVRWAPADGAATRRAVVVATTRNIVVVHDRARKNAI